MTSHVDEDQKQIFSLKRQQKKPRSKKGFTSKTDVVDDTIREREIEEEQTCHSGKRKMWRGTRTHGWEASFESPWTHEGCEGNARWWKHQKFLRFNLITMRASALTSISSRCTLMLSDNKIKSNLLDVRIGSDVGKSKCFRSWCEEMWGPKHEWNYGFIYLSP